MKHTIQENILHYYVDLLRMKEDKQRDPDLTDQCVNALNNIIQTMRCSRHNTICSEDFSHLDFGNIPFNGIQFSLNGECPSKFSECKVNEYNFISGHSDRVTAIAWSSDRKRIVTGSEDRSVILWDFTTGLMIRKYKTHTDTVTAVAVSDDDNFILAGYDDGSAVVFDLPTGDIILEAAKHDQSVRKVSFTVDNKYGLFITTEPSAMILDIEAKTSMPITVCNTVGIEQLKGFHNKLKNCSNTVLAETEDGLCLFLLDQAMTYPSKLRLCLGIISDSFIESDTFSDLMSGCEDEVIELYKIPFHTANTICIITEAQFRLALTEHENMVYSSDLNYCLTAKIEDISLLYAPGEGIDLTDEKFLDSVPNHAEIWDSSFDHIPIILHGHDTPICQTVFSQDHSCCLTRSVDNIIKIWRTRDGECICTIRDYYNDDYTTKLNSNRSLGDVIGTLHADNGGKAILYIDSILLSISPDSRFLMIAYAKQSISIWDIQTGQCIKKINSYDSNISDVYLSDNSDYCLTIGSSKKIWDVKKERCIRDIDMDEKQEHLTIWKELTNETLNEEKLWSSNYQYQHYHLLREEKTIWSPDHQYYLEKRGKSFQLWSKQEQSCIAVFDESLCAFSKDGLYCIVFDVTNRVVKRWDIKTEKYKVKFFGAELLCERSNQLRWGYPFYSFFHNNFAKICEWDYITGTDKVETQSISTLYDSNNLSIKGCDFRSVVSDDKTLTILYQYGAITE